MSLPTESLLRTYLIMSLSSSPFLLNLSTKALQRMLHARTPVFDVERNPVLRWILKGTFYKQFCAGENLEEVSETVKAFHDAGSGVMLEYAKEVLENAVAKSSDQARSDVNQWKEGVLQTIQMVDAGDSVALKWSGMGSEALRLMKTGSNPSGDMLRAMHDICDAAAEKGVALMPSAEPQNANHAVDQWNMALAQRYNTDCRFLIYNTYQAYLKSAPATLAKHLDMARQSGFALGVKLVRGAYLHSEPRQLIWDTKELTDRAYDGMAAAILSRRYNEVVRACNIKYESFPQVGLNLATHNRESVHKAFALQSARASEGRDAVEMQFAQLHGMADDLNCEIVSEVARTAVPGGYSPKVLKFVTWGSMKDCLHYLLRRADENKDAMARTVATRKVMRREILRRLLSLWPGRQRP